MNIKLIAFLTSLILVLSLTVVSLSIGRPQPQSQDLQEISQSQGISQSPGFVDELWEDHLDSISLSDARDLASFTVRLPDNLPPGFTVRHAIHEKSDGFATFKGERFISESVTLIFWDRELPDRVTYQEGNDGGAIWLRITYSLGENTTAYYENPGYAKPGEVQYLWGYPAVVRERMVQVFQFEEKLVYRLYGDQYDQEQLLAMMESLIRNLSS